MKAGAKGLEKYKAGSEGLAGAGRALAVLEQIHDRYVVAPGR